MQNGKVWELSLLNADRPFEVGLAAIVSAMVMFFYLCSDYDNAIRMILIDTGDEVGVSRVRVSNWTALLAFLQVRARRHSISRIAHHTLVSL